MTQAYELATAPPARRALADRLPSDVALAAVELITAPRGHNPRRSGNPLRQALAGVYSARLGREWRVLYEIDENKHTVIVLDIQHRSAAFRPG